MERSVIKQKIIELLEQDSPSCPHLNEVLHLDGCVALFEKPEGDDCRFVIIEVRTGYIMEYGDHGDTFVYDDSRHDQEEVQWAFGLLTELTE